MATEEARVEGTTDEKALLGEPLALEGSYALPTFYSELGEEQKRMLEEPLERDRVKSRSGRGGGSFSYIETHDAVRTANRIFGYGQWGHRIVEQERIGEVAVVSRSNKPGYHVAYRCVVELNVAGCVPVCGSGYGDGVEYGPAAQLTASELALKESESDALKRALKNYGDQFGLILYAKTDGDHRDASQQNADQARSDVPVTAADAMGRLTSFVADAAPWVKEATLAFYPDVKEWPEGGYGKLPEPVRNDLRRRLSVAVLDLEAAQADGFNPYPDGSPPYDDPPGHLDVIRDRVVAAFAKAFDGVAVAGPDPFDPALKF